MADYIEYRVVYKKNKEDALFRFYPSKKKVEIFHNIEEKSATKGSIKHAALRCPDGKSATKGSINYVTFGCPNDKCYTDTKNIIRNHRKSGGGLLVSVGFTVSIRTIKDRKLVLKEEQVILWNTKKNDHIIGITGAELIKFMSSTKKELVVSLSSSELNSEQIAPKKTIWSNYKLMIKCDDMYNSNIILKDSGVSENFQVEGRNLKIYVLSVEDNGICNDLFNISIKCIKNIS
jgi:hypothetical protein